MTGRFVSISTTRRAPQVQRRSSRGRQGRRRGPVEAGGGLGDRRGWRGVGEAGQLTLARPGGKHRGARLGRDVARIFLRHQKTLIFYLARGIDYEQEFGISGIGTADIAARICLGDDRHWGGGSHL